MFKTMKILPFYSQYDRIYFPCWYAH